MHGVQQQAQPKPQRSVRRNTLRLVIALLIAVVGIAGIALAVRMLQDEDAVVVSKIVDGDTIVVTHSGEETRVRLLNIDTPEKEECLYKESTKHLESLIAPGESVNLVYDVERVDRYGRDLAGVYKQDGTFVNEVMVADGFARAVEFQPNTKFTSTMRAAEARAKDAGLGIYGVPTECLLPTDIARDALARYQSDPDPFYLDVMRDAVEGTKSFTYREQALDLINSL